MTTLPDFLQSKGEPPDVPMVDEVFINYRAVFDDDQIILDLAVQVDNGEHEDEFEVHGVSFDYEELDVYNMIEGLRSLADLLEERYGSPETSVS